MKFDSKIYLSSTIDTNFKDKINGFMFGYKFGELFTSDGSNIPY